MQGKGMIARRNGAKDTREFPKLLTPKERQRLATAEHHKPSDAISPENYARSKPAEKRGTRSTQGVSIIHTGRNRAGRRADRAFSRHCLYAPISHALLRIGNRSARKREAKREFALTLRVQSLRESAQRKERKRWYGHK